ncbi:major facilitator superfamily domain-containing protein [Fimicolochytrium jonesii]|uniref:major facilitator superfamily domain-containing protein n=1 Tax=Fimicolochytrium jonesii TaxID=1396493 RepID=UPI0022FE2ACC|nr:major facilitator superfamily domain-containing protein [Fimicolochytrium jonesii]KAI8817465.1 major facilitator superfamily domain-containing protein [Fimicolochytrium jonesii]
MQEDGSRRWVILGLGCMLLVGTNYAYDAPASLALLLATYLHETPAEHQYTLSTLYALYSLPNTILPFYGGRLVDSMGTKRMMLWCAGLVVVGQGVFAVGVQRRVKMGMWMGRLLFGVGAETLGVVQTRLTTKYFLHKELALSLGLELSIARLGSVLNDLITPHLGARLSVPIAVWAGFLSCVLSFVCAILLARLDDLPESRDGEASGGSMREAVKSYPRAFWTICAVMCVLYATMVPFNTVHAGFLQTRWYPGDPEKAAQLSSIPDTLSALLVPLVGHLTDTHGHRTTSLLACAALILAVHTFLGLAPFEWTPIPALAMLGPAYALLLSVWPCVAIVVGGRGGGLAFGITTSLLNISLTLFPLIVARLIVLDGTYTLAELFFASCAAAGVVLTCVLMTDREWGAALQRRGAVDGADANGNGEGDVGLRTRGMRGEYMGLEDME